MIKKGDKEKAGEYYKKTKEAIKEKQRNKYKNLTELKRIELKRRERIEKAIFKK